MLHDTDGSKKANNVEVRNLSAPEIANRRLYGLAPVARAPLRPHECIQLWRKLLLVR